MNQNTNNNIETTLESLFRRRSHRAFAQAPIDEQSITTIIQAGAAAPSAHGKKPFRFARIENKATIEAIVEKFPWFAPAGKAASTFLFSGTRNNARELNTGQSTAPPQPRIFCLRLRRSVSGLYGWE